MPSLSTIAGFNLDIQAYAGDNCQFVLQFKDDVGAAMSLTGLALKMQIKKNKTGAALLTWTVGRGLVVSGDNTDTVTFDNKITLPGGMYPYDLQATDLTGVISTFVYGNFIVIQDVTDATT